MSEPEQKPKDSPPYASDGAERWIDLLKNTRVLEATGRLKAPSQSNYREEPESSKQPDFFRTPVVDLSHKDDVNLMDFTPFGLGKTPRFDTIEYKLTNCTARVYGSTEHGLATVYDYDIVIFMISQLANQMNDVRQRIETGEDNPELPNRRMHVYASDMLEGIKRPQGGNQQSELTQRLQRLKGSVIELHGKEGTKRRLGTFSLIGDFSITKDTKTGKISEFFIDIPEWIYDGVVRVSHPSVVNLSENYMLLKSGYHKFLARMAKKSAGEGQWEWKVETLYERSGSKQPMAQFKRDIKESIDKLQKDPLKGYEVTYREEGQGKGNRKALKIKFKKTA